MKQYPNFKAIELELLVTNMTALLHYWEMVIAGVAKENTV